MSLFLAKKLENTNQKKVKDLLRKKENKKCFDCQAKGPIFANTTIQTFICARCSDFVRDFGHRVKAVSTSKFSGAELLALKKGGNKIAQKIWASSYNPPEITEPESDEDVLLLMRQKYLENKWLDRALLQSHKEEVRKLISKSFNEDGLPIVTKTVKTKVAPGFSRLPLIADDEINIMDEEEEDDEGYRGYDFPVSKLDILPNRSISQTLIPPTTTQIVTTSFETKRSSVESQRSETSFSSASIHSSYSGSSSNSWNSTNNSLSTNLVNSSITAKRQLKLTEAYSPNPQVLNGQLQSFSAPEVFNEVKIDTNMLQHEKLNMLIDTNNTITGSSHANPATRVTVKPLKTESTLNAFDNIMSELSGLKLEKTVRSATYTGGILAPTLNISKPLTPSTSNEIKERKEDPVSIFDSDFFAKFNLTTSIKSHNNDQYSALRGISVQPTVNREADKTNTSSSEDEDDDDPWQEFCSSSSFEDEVQTTVTNIKPNEAVVSIDLFSDLDPRSMFKRL